MPVWNVLISDAGGDVKHDDTALSVDVVAIAQATKLLLAGGVPDIKDDCAKVLQLHEHDVVRVGQLWILTVVKLRGCTSTPKVAIYFFSNSPVRWRLTKVVSSG